MRYDSQALLTTPNAARRRWTSTIASVAMLASTVVATEAATVPYTEDFNDETAGVTTGPSEPSPEGGTFTQNTVTLGASPATGSAAFSVDAAGHYQVLTTSNKSSSTDNATVVAASSLQFPGLGTGGFNIAADVARDDVPDGLGNNGYAVASVVARGAGSDLTSSTSGYRLILSLSAGNNVGTSSLNKTGRLRLEEGGAGAFATVSSATLATIATDAFYTLSLTGTPNGAALDLVGTLSDSLGNVLFTLNATDLTPQTGEHFGLRTVTVNSTGTRTAAIDYDDVSVTATAVPEPTGLAVLGAISTMGLLRRARRS